MLDTHYRDRPIAVDRQKRHAKWAANIIKHSGMPPDSCSLYFELLDLPPTWEINQRYVVNTLQRYGGEKRVRRMFKDIISAGRMRERIFRESDGRFIRGIYEISDEPKWLKQPHREAVDISEITEGFENSKDAEIAEGKACERRAANRRVGIYNSRPNPDSTTGPVDVETLTSSRLQAESRNCGSKSNLTNEAERRTGGAKAGLPRKEPGSRPAKGSPVKGVSCGAGDETDNDRNTERLKRQLFEVAAFSGSRMPNPRTAAGLVPCLVQWQMEQLDFERDVLPAIADVCGRAGDPDKPIVSWRYFIGAIRDRRAQRIAAVKPARPDNSSDQVDWWHRLTLYINDKRHIWPTAKWGPRPGEENCLIPQQIIREFASKHAHYLERNAVPGLNS